MTLAAYFLVTRHVIGGWMIVAAIVTLGTVQGIVQLLLFLNLGQESKPQWRLHALIFMVVIAIIVVGGSLWIMYNLDYRMMPEAEMTKQMQKNL